MWSQQSATVLEENPTPDWTLQRIKANGEALVKGPRGNPRGELSKRPIFTAWKGGRARRCG